MRRSEFYITIAIAIVSAAAIGVLFGVMIVKDSEIAGLKLHVAELQGELEVERNKATLYQVSIDSLKKESEAKDEALQQYSDKETVYEEFLAFVSGVLQERIDVGDLRVQSNVSNEWIDNFFKGTPLEGYGRAFTIAERVYGVNAIMLAKMAAHESAYGTSKIARCKNNLFGFMAYDADAYEYAKRFDTVEDCLNNVAKYITENYLDSDGKYHNGTTLKDIGVMWATDRRWAEKIESIAVR
jgi:beta-N-acetylglucosaminidase